MAFKLYDTFGFPLDLTEDMLRNINLHVDIQTFETLMNEQKQKSKKLHGKEAAIYKTRVILNKY